jgi:hypothetical protein
MGHLAEGTASSRALRTISEWSGNADFGIIPRRRIDSRGRPTAVEAGLVMSELFKLILVIVETAVRNLALGAAERRQQWETDPVPVHFLDVLC